MKTERFKTHKGYIVTGSELQKALSAVANDWRKLARAIRKEDSYASHVSEDIKENNLQNMLIDADRIEQGYIDSFTIWQRVNTKLTGECVALLS